MVVAALELGEAASTSGKTVAAFAGAEVVAGEVVVATQAPVEIVEAVGLHNLPVAVEEFLPVVAAGAVAGLGAAAGVVAGALDLRRKGSDFHRDPFVERHDPSK